MDSTDICVFQYIHVALYFLCGFLFISWILVRIYSGICIQLLGDCEFPIVMSSRDQVGRLDGVGQPLLLRFLFNLLAVYLAYYDTGHVYWLVVLCFVGLFIANVIVLVYPYFNLIFGMVNFWSSGFFPNWVNNS